MSRGVVARIQPQAEHFAHAPSRLLQRTCSCGQHTTDQHGGCTECSKNRHALQREAVNRSEPQTAPRIVHDVLRSNGQPLDAGTRAFMEPRFGRDFTGVRVHTDTRAAESARAVSARAYTVGQDVVFGAGQYAPRTAAGKRLLAHELTHTVQQRSNGSLARASLALAPADGREREAAQMADRVVSSDGPAPTPIRSTTSRVQRLGDLSQVPPMSCPVANTSPTPAIQNVLFGTSASTLDATQRTEIENFVTSWHAARTTPVVRVDGFASTDGPDGLNWQLSCARAEAVVRELTSPSSGATPGIPAGFLDHFAQGETTEFSASLAPNRRATVTTTAPLPLPICTHPGASRSVDLQPIFFRSSILDFTPTGQSWPRRLNESARIWGKLGVTFHELTPITLIDATHKTQGGTDPERASILGLRTGAGIEVFAVDNDLVDVGGAARFGPRGPDSKIIMSDRGTSDTLLAHELGHALGLGHPGEGGGHGGDPGTIMEPSGSHSTANPTRNTIVNHNRMTWPATGSTCLTPDP
jgi:outer membrane protein OmpA-like peptidoglycan-associated protein